jgi:hypothetical protein
MIALLHQELVAFAIESRITMTIRFPASLRAVAWFCLASAWVFTTMAEQTQLRPPVLLLAGSNTLSPGSYAIPCVTDWNGDGRKDLVVGYRYADKVALYLNAGTDASPVFSNLTNLQAGGVDICHPSVSCGAPAPWVCDYDGDGRRDLLVGTGAEGYVYFYRNTNTDANPILAPGQQLMVGSNVVLTVSGRATPCVHDWDGDGLDDLICGSVNGPVFLFQNVGTRQVPVYASGTNFWAGGVMLNLGARSVARVFDWDGDGLKDLVGSSSTGVYWCRNIGRNAAPSLAAPMPIPAPVASGGLSSIYTSYRMRMFLVDWNDDGVVDLLLGNAEGTISCFDGYRFRFTSFEAQSGTRCAFQWNSAPYLKYHVLGGSTLNSLGNLLVSNLPSGGNVTCWTNPIQTDCEFYRAKVAE